MRQVIENTKIADCYHCSNKGKMSIKDVYKKETSEISKDDYFYDMNIVLFCPVCKSYSIINAYWDHTFGKTNLSDEQDIYNGDLVEEKYLYPIPSNLIAQKSNMIPKDVINSFERAVKLMNVDEESCLIKLRKTLEMICSDQGAIGDNLFQMISCLSNNGILPKTLNSASTLARKLGNIGAHERNIEIDLTELKIVIDLVEYIIQYIYVLPKEIERLENRFNLNEINKEKLSN